MKPLSDDHRTRVTRMLIRRAFTDLLSHKPVSYTHLDVYKSQPTGTEPASTRRSKFRPANAPAS